MSDLKTQNIEDAITLIPLDNTGDADIQDSARKELAALLAEIERMRVECARLRDDRDLEKRWRKDAEEVREAALSEVERLKNQNTHRQVVVESEWTDGNDVHEKAKECGGKA